MELEPLVVAFNKYTPFSSDLVGLIREYIRDSNWRGLFNGCVFELQCNMYAVRTKLDGARCADVAREKVEGSTMYATNRIVRTEIGIWRIRSIGWWMGEPPKDAAEALVSCDDWTSHFRQSEWPLDIAIKLGKLKRKVQDGDEEKAKKRQRLLGIDRDPVWVDSSTGVHDSSG